MYRGLATALVLAFTVAGCGAVATTPFATPLESFGTASGTPSAAPASLTAGGATDCDTSNVTVLHQAPELEAKLPASVADRPLARWSVRGRCWTQAISGIPPAKIDEYFQGFETAGDPAPIDPANLAFGVAGRSDTHTDPPSFVFVAARPLARDEGAVALFQLAFAAGFHEPSAVGDLTLFEERTIAGRKVYVGDVDMLEQNEHQRGRPYLYQTDDDLYILVTDDDGWASDAIAQLP